MTLHDVIVAVLQDAERFMSTSDIAVEVNRRGSYRKRDGTAVSPFQVHGRTKNYPRLFVRQGSQVGLRDWDSDIISELGTESVDASGAAGKILLRIADTEDVGNTGFLTSAGFTCLGQIGQLLQNGPAQVA